MRVEFDSALIRRYGGNAPRYTSYPTAVQFHDRISHDDYRRAAARSASNLDRAPLSLYVHIPFCTSPCYYCACNRIITRQRDVATRYCRHLVQEIVQRGALFEHAGPVQQLHFGGGTPTYLRSTEIIELIGQLGRHFRLTDSPARDYSIEIDPRTVDADTLPALHSAGFNRLSLGVQDFDDQVQRTINRLQSVEMVRAVLLQARENGFRSVNFDLIYGLPRQTPASFETTLQHVMTMRPERVALYGYAHMPAAFKAQRRFKPEDLPSAETRIALLDLAIRNLTQAGYEHIGMDHFALPDDALVKARDDGTLHRNFQGYTTHADSDLISVGSSAIGRVSNLFVQNEKSVGAYQTALAAGRLPLAKGRLLDRDDEIRADVIQRIMCRRHIAIDEVEQHWHMSFRRYFADELDALGALEVDGLLSVNPHHIQLTPRGSFLMRNVALVFDAYATPASGSPRASQAI